MEAVDNFVVNLLKGMEIFSDLDFQPLKELSQLFEENIYNEGDIIFEEDSIGNSMMIITSGKVRISQRPDPDSEEALIFLSRGDIFGEMALLDDLPRSATAIAHSDVIIFEISRKNFLYFIDLNTAAGVKILFKLAKILSSRLRETDLKLKTFITLSKWS
jgi:CRP-like cAMP-binding protein